MSARGAEAVCQAASRQLHGPSSHTGSARGISPDARGRWQEGVSGPHCEG